MLVLLPLVLLLSACSSYQLARAVLPIAEEGKPIPELERLCETEAGVHIYEQPPPVKGFVLMPLTSYRNGPDQPATGIGPGGCYFECVELLSGHGYDFIEAPFHPSEMWSKDFAEKKEGFYRYRLVPRESGQCERFDLLARYSAGLRNDAEKYNLGDRCIVAEPIPAFTARYQVEWNDIWRAIADYDGASGGVVSEGQRIIRDRETGKVMMRGSSFSYQNVRYMNRHLGQCVPDEIDHFEVWKYLPPAKSQAVSRS